MSLTDRIPRRKAFSSSITSRVNLGSASIIGASFFPPKEILDCKVILLGFSS